MCSKEFGSVLLCVYVRSLALPFCLEICTASQKYGVVLCVHQIPNAFFLHIKLNGMAGGNQIRKNVCPMQITKTNNYVCIFFSVCLEYWKIPSGEKKTSLKSDFTNIYWSSAPMKISSNIATWKVVESFFLALVVYCMLMPRKCRKPQINFQTLKLYQFCTKTFDWYRGNPKGIPIQIKLIVFSCVVRKNGGTKRRRRRCTFLLHF